MSKLFSLLLVVSALLPLVIAQGGSPTYDDIDISCTYTHAKSLSASDQSDAPAFRVTTALSSLNITSCKPGGPASVIGLNAVLYSYNSVTKVSTQIATIATSTRAAPCWSYKYPAGVVPAGWYYVLLSPGEAGQYGAYSLSLVCPTGESTSVCSIGTENTCGINSNSTSSASSRFNTGSPVLGGSIMFVTTAFGLLVSAIIAFIVRA